MKQVFDASSSIEAYMIKSLLHSNGIDSQVLGEHLSSGIGELPAVGVVRVAVDDDDYSFARKIIHDWEVSKTVDPQMLDEWQSDQPYSESEDHIKSKQKALSTLSTFMGGILIGLIVGAGFMFLLLSKN